MVPGHQWEVWWGLRKSPLLFPNKAGEDAKETCNTYRKPPMQRRRFPLTEKVSTVFTSLFENTHGKWIYTWKNSEMKLMLAHLCVAHWGLQFSWCTIRDMFLTTKCHNVIRSFCVTKGNGKCLEVMSVTHTLYHGILNRLPLWESSHEKAIKLNSHHSTVEVSWRRIFLWLFFL